MTADPVAQLEELNREYCPMLDRLLSATPDNVQDLIKKETGVARRIWIAAETAFGSPGRARLEFLKPSSEELTEIEWWLQARAWLSDDHRIATVCCCARSKRLARMLQEVELGRPKGKGGRPALDPPEEIEKGRQLVRHGRSGRGAAEEMGKRRGLSGKALKRYINRNHKKLTR